MKSITLSWHSTFRPAESGKSNPYPNQPKPDLDPIGFCLNLSWINKGFRFSIGLDWVSVGLGDFWLPWGLLADSVKFWSIQTEFQLILNICINFHLIDPFKVLFLPLLAIFGAWISELSTPVVSMMNTKLELSFSLATLNSPMTSIKFNGKKLGKNTNFTH